MKVHVLSLPCKQHGLDDDVNGHPVSSGRQDVLNTLKLE